MAKYMGMDDQKLDFRSSLGPKEQQIYDEREEDLELHILETIDKHAEKGEVTVGWLEVGRVFIKSPSFPSSQFFPMSYFCFGTKRSHFWHFR